MSANIISVDGGSPAKKAGIRPGDILVSVAGHTINDVFDLKFYSYDPSVEVAVLRDNVPLTFVVTKQVGEPLGLEFETYLIDNPRSCTNNCVFCFIDQMPPDMRETLYFKDDDSRLSFLQGNYITLTNLSNADVKRIIDMRISPINISIHTTNPELRVQMLGNNNAGRSLSKLRQLADAGLTLNGQIVVCPGLNDGAELRRTLSDLMDYVPELASVSIVPVGITKYRTGLCDLLPVEKDNALDIISTVDEFGRICSESFGSRIFYCSDELYITAQLSFPPYEYYEDFPQFENGVGMAVMFGDDFARKLEQLSPEDKAVPFTAVTGTLFYPTLCKMIDLLRNKCHNILGKVVTVENKFFGEKITVAGLVTGGDLIRTLKELGIKGRVLIPEVMLRSGERVFLDDITIDDIERTLNIELIPVPNDGTELIDYIMR